MIPESVKRDHVLQAIRRVRINGVPRGRRSRDYCLIYKDIHYPPKYLISLGHRIATEELLPPGSFNGGKESNNFLTSLEFMVVKCDCKQPTIQDQNTTYQPQGKGTGSTFHPIHPENGKEHLKLNFYEHSIESNNKTPKHWVVCVVAELKPEGNDNEQLKALNDERLKALNIAINVVSEKINGKVVILFPAGWFNAGYEEACSLYAWVEKNIQKTLQYNREEIVVCVGIDGKKIEQKRDQIGVAVSKNGIQAKARKFYPTKEEKGIIDIADDYFCNEDGKPRRFELGGFKYYLAVCYDTYGIRKEERRRPEIDFVLNMVHGFNPRGQRGCGEVFFAKWGFAGASKQWDCTVFAAASFFGRVIPQRWPPGVYWNQGDMDIKWWKYEHNPLNARYIFDVPTNGSLAQVYIYG